MTMDSPEDQEPLDRTDAQVYQERKVTVETRACPVCQDFPVPRARQVSWAFPESTDGLDPMVRLVRLARAVYRESPVTKEPWASTVTVERTDTTDCQAFPDSRGRLESREGKEKTARSDSPDFMALLAPMACRVPLEPPEKRANAERTDIPACLENPDPMATPERRVWMERLDCQASLESRENPASRVRLESRVLVPMREHLVRQECAGPKDHQDCPESLASRENAVKRANQALDIRENREWSEKQEMSDMTACPECPDSPERPALSDLLGHLDPLVTLVCQVWTACQASQACPVWMETAEMQACQACLVHLDSPAHLVCQERRATPAYPAIAASLELPAVWVRPASVERVALPDTSVLLVCLASSVFPVIKA